VTPGDSRKVALLFGATVLAAVLIVVGAPRLLGYAAGPDAAIAGLLEKTSKEGMTLAVPGSATPLVSVRHHYDRISLQLDPTGRRATAACTLDFVGRFGDTEVSSLGVEKIPFVDESGWRPVEGWAPRLQAAVAALELRRRALETGDAALLTRIASADAGTPELFSVRDRSLRARAWFLRLDRDDAQVTEKYRLTGSLPDRPVDEEGTRSLQMERRGGEFFFSRGLM
jgi:hypothetical protein